MIDEQLHSLSGQLAIHRSRGKRKTQKRDKGETMGIKTQEQIR